MQSDIFARIGWQWLLYLTMFAVSLAFMACKAVQTPTSTALDAQAVRAAGEAPITHYALKSSIKRMFETITLVESGMQQGAHVYTVTRVTFDGFESDQGGVTAAVLLDLSIDASKSQSITRRVGAGVNLTFWGQARARVRISQSQSMVDVKYLGLQWTQPLRHHINTWTNARLFRGVIHNKARQQAAAAVPGTKREIKRQVDQQIRTGIDQQLGNYRHYFVDLARLMRDVPGARPRLASDRQGAYFQHHIKTPLASTITRPPDTPRTVDSGFVFHESAFASLLAPNLAGKTIPLKDLQETVCKSFTNSMYKLCSQEALKVPVDVDLVFPEENPVQFSFEGQAIKLNLNFSIKIASNKKTIDLVSNFLKAGENIYNAFQLTDEETGPIAGAAIEPQADVEEPVKYAHYTPLVKFELRYLLGNRRFERTVNEVNLAEVQEQDGPWTKSPIYREGLKKMLAHNLERSLPLKIDVPAAPTYAIASAPVQKLGGSFVVMKKQDFAIKGEWLHAYFTHCGKRDTQYSLGISMKEIKDTGGTNRIKISAVHNSTPAMRAAVESFEPIIEDEDIKVDYKPAAGLKVGDVIYNVDGEDQYVGNATMFAGALTGKSLTDDRKVRLQVGRKMQLEGFEEPIWMMIDYDVELQKVCRVAE